MDVLWTTSSAIPTYLYRVLHPLSPTHYDPATGLRAALSSPEQCFIPSTNLDVFFQSIESHRQQRWKLSPYISLFEDINEAESWALAVEDFFGEETWIVRVNMPLWEDLVKHSVEREREKDEKKKVVAVNGVKAVRKNAVKAVEAAEEMEKLGERVVWFVGDIMAQSEKLRLTMSPKEGPVRRDIELKAETEWLALYHIPGAAMRILKGSKRVRAERNWP